MSCVSVALIIQQANRVFRIILPYVACLDLPYFSTLSPKGTISEKELLKIKCLF